MNNTRNTEDETEMAPPVLRCHFDVGLFDPAWPGQGGEAHYPTMPLRSIANMAEGVKAVMKPDSWLFLWTTKSLVAEATAIMRDWGYEPRDTIWWTKLNRFGVGNPKYGIRRAVEPLLVGTRGDVTAATRITPDWFAAPVGRHSEKPHHQYALIDALCGMDVTRAEFFARHKQPGYLAWGNEVDADFTLAPWGYPVPSDKNRSRREEVGDGS